MRSRDSLSGFTINSRIQHWDYQKTRTRRDGCAAAAKILPMLAAARYSLVEKNRPVNARGGS